MFNEIDPLESGDYSGDPYTAGAAGMPSDYGRGMPGDYADEQAMGRWNPPQAAAQGAPWWAGIAAYGVTRAIDNQFPGSPTGVMGNVYPGSVGGWNGRTYTNRPIGAGGGVASANARLSLGGNPILWIGLAVLAYAAMK